MVWYCETWQREYATRYQRPEEFVAELRQARAQGWHLVSAIQREQDLIVTFTRRSAAESREAPEGVS
jgi:hypothetical protein